MARLARWRTLGGSVVVVLSIAVGCGGSEDNAPPITDTDASASGGATGTGGKAGAGGSTAGAAGQQEAGVEASVGGSSNGGAAGQAGAPATGGTAGDDAGADVSVGGAAGQAGAAGTGGASPYDAGIIILQCQGHVYECGDTLDNDNDGLIDMMDPDCLGPCHNNERGYFLNIPGGGAASNCKLDCYFDQDTGNGNDECYWNHNCDPLETAANGWHPEGTNCTYNPNANTPGTSASCAELLNDQTDYCEQFCAPLVPNGCDCFGCCELPAGSNKFVWLGSQVNDVGSCDIASVGDPSKCQPCTPVKGTCYNACEHCELCLGKTELPADCFPPGPDAGAGGTSGAGGSPGTGGSGGTPGSGGTAGAGGTPGTGGTAGAGGTPGCGGQICPVGSQACGLSCQPPCPTGQFCLTGCCQKNPM